ncbi:HPr family phosphocarrier protein [Eubacterium sp.]
MIEVNEKTNKYLVNLNEVMKLKDFVAKVTKFDFDIDAKATNRDAIYDAKSIMALFSLDLSRDIEIIPHTNDVNKLNIFEDVIGEYISRN